MSTKPFAVIRRVGVAVGVLVLVVAVLAVVTALRSAGSESSETRVLPVEVPRLRVDLGSGDVRVKTGADGEVRLQRTVHSAWRSPTYSEESGPDGVRIKASCPALSFGTCSIDYTLTVPADMRADLEVSSGDVRVSGLSAATKVRASSGNIDVTNMTGRVDLDASSGDISARGVRSDSVEADSSSGDVQLTFAEPPGSVDVSASSGDVTLSLPKTDTAYDVDVSTSSGSEQVNVPTDSTATNKLTVKVSSGDVLLHTR